MFIKLEMDLHCIKKDLEYLCNIFVCDHFANVLSNLISLHITMYLLTYVVRVDLLICMNMVCNMSKSQMTLTVYMLDIINHMVILF